MSRMKSLPLSLVLGTALAVGSVAQADSIWARRNPRYSFLFEDQRARRIGDLVTVLVLENSNINQTEQRDNNKSTNAQNQLTFDGTTASDNGGRTGNLDVTFQNQSNRSFTGNAQFTSDRRFTDRVTATVVDVLPNGVLVVQGYRCRVIAGERRYLKVTGMVRPQDLTQLNTVTSDFVANFKVEYFGRGTDSRFTNQNYLGRLFNYIWPF